MPNFLDLITFYDKNGEPQIAASESDIASLRQYINTKQDVIHANLSLSYHDNIVSFGFNDNDGRAGVFLSTTDGSQSEGSLTIRNNNGSIVLETDSGDIGESGVLIKCQGTSFLDIFANDRESTYTVNCNGDWIFNGDLVMEGSLVATRDWVQQNVSVEIGDSLLVGELEILGDPHSNAYIRSENTGICIESSSYIDGIVLENIPYHSKISVGEYISLNTPDRVWITTGDYTINSGTPQGLYYTSILSSQDRFEIKSDRYGDDSQNRGANQIAFNENGIDIINSISGYSSSYDNNAIRSDINIKQTGDYGGINIASEGSAYTYVNMTCNKGADSFGINIKSEYGMDSLSAKVGSNGMMITDGTSGSYNGTTFTGNIKFTGNVEGISGGGSECYVFGVSTLPRTQQLDNGEIRLDEQAYFKIVVPSNIEFPDDPNSDGGLLNDWWDVVKNHMVKGQSFAEFEDSMAYSEAVSAKSETLSMVTSTISLAHKFFFNYLSTYSYWNNNGSTIPCQAITSFIPYKISVEYDEQKDGNLLEVITIDDAHNIIMPPYIMYESGIIVIAYDRIENGSRYEELDSLIWSNGYQNQIIVGAFYDNDIMKSLESQNTFYNENSNGDFIFTSQIRYLGKL